MSTLPRKDAGIAALIAGLVGLVLMGIGHLYVGKIGRGILILAAGILARVALLWSGFGFILGSVAAGVLGIVIVVLINLGLWIFSTLVRTIV